MERIGRPSKGRQEYLDKPTYLRRLKTEFAIGTIYYPGCGNDRILEGPFSEAEIFYADEYDLVFRGRRNFVKGDMGKALYPDGKFDAMFYQDADVEPPVFRAALRAVRRNGILVFSSDDCGWGVQLKHLSEFPEIHPLELPYRTEHFNPFRKID